MTGVESLSRGANFDTMLDIMSHEPHNALCHTLCWLTWQHACIHAFIAHQNLHVLYIILNDHVRTTLGTGVTCQMITRSLAVGGVHVNGGLGKLIWRWAGGYWLAMTHRSDSQWTCRSWTRAGTWLGAAQSTTPTMGCSLACSLWAGMFAQDASAPSNVGFVHVLGVWWCTTAVEIVNGLTGEPTAWHALHLRMFSWRGLERDLMQRRQRSW
jgi:hypothetical protein